MTDNYMDMCRKAEEVQKLWKPKVGDFCYGNKPVENYILQYTDFENYPYVKGGGLIWLPRLDQLFGMIDYQNADSYTSLSIVFYCLFEITRDRQLGAIDYNSPEEVFLSSVMKANFKKSWNGKEWESENKK
jgi:hypothetical protein